MWVKINIFCFEIEIQTISHHDLHLDNNDVRVPSAKDAEPSYEDAC